MAGILDLLFPILCFVIIKLSADLKAAKKNAKVISLHRRASQE